MRRGERQVTITVSSVESYDCFLSVVASNPLHEVVNVLEQHEGAGSVCCQNALKCIGLVGAVGRRMGEWENGRMGE